MDHYPGLTYEDLRRAIFLVLAIYLALRFANALALLLLVFLLALVLAAVLNPLVTRLQRWGVPRAIGGASVGLFFLALFVATLWFGVPPLARQVLDLAKALPGLLTDLGEQAQSLLARYTGGQIQLPTPEELAARVLPYLGNLLGYLGATLQALLIGVSLFVMGIVVVIYALAQPEPLVRGLLTAIPERYRASTQAVFRQIMEQLTAWAVSSIILGVTVAVMVAIALEVVGMRFVFLFAVIAGIGEMIPTLGPIISAIPPVVVALAIDPRLALWVALAFWIVQMLENHLIVPLVMGGRLALHPISVIFMIIALGTLYGVLGAILAVPATVIIKALYQQFYLEPRRAEAEPVAEETRRLIAA